MNGNNNGTLNCQVRGPISRAHQFDAKPEQKWGKMNLTIKVNAPGGKFAYIDIAFVDSEEICSKESKKLIGAWIEADISFLRVADCYKDNKGAWRSGRCQFVANSIKLISEAQRVDSQLAELEKMKAELLAYKASL